jgi:hypothetical protein
LNKERLQELKELNDIRSRAWGEARDYLDFSYSISDLLCDIDELIEELEKYVKD